MPLATLFRTESEIIQEVTKKVEENDGHHNYASTLMATQHLDQDRACVIELLDQPEVHSDNTIEHDHEENDLKLGDEDEQGY